jgi:fatty acid CoA ligase FadD9
MVPEPILSHEVVWKEITQDTKTVCEVFTKMFKAYPHRPCIGYKIEKESGKTVTVDDYVEGSQEELFANIHKYDYKWLTFQQIETRVKHIGSALAAKFPAQSHIGIASRNRVEWFMTDLACQMYSFVTVPLHFASKEEDAVFIINNAHLKAVVCSSELVPIYLEAVKQCPQLEFIVQMDAVDYSQQVNALIAETKRESNKQLMYTLEEFEELGKSALIEPRKRDAEQLATLIYTSGSTGRPKGAMITDKIWRSLLCEGRYPEDPLVGVSKDSLAHISDREVTYTVLINGGRIGISNDPRTVYVDILLVQPVFVDSTPRFYDVIYNEFKKALAIEERSLMASLGLTSLSNEQKAEIRRAVLTKFSGILGGRITNIGMGGAAINPVVKAFCVECFKSASVREGYGTTEVGTIADDRGDVRYGVVFKLLDVPEMGYFTTDNPPKGELLVRSTSSIKGYFNNTEDTERNFDSEGFFRTGDIVEQLGPRNIRIIDRKKNIFKLSQGEFVSPEPLEACYMDSPYVEQILITCGDSNLGILQTSVVAVVVPNQVMLMKWAADKGLAGDFVSLCAKQDAKEFMLHHLIEIGQKRKLRSFEIPCTVVLDSIEWTVQNGKMTSSSKKCRPVLEKLYRLLVNETLFELGEQSTEQQLQLIMSEVLGKDGYDVLKEKSNFTSLGGDSLSAIKLVALVKQNFNVDLSLESLYSDSMSEIAATITSNVNNVNVNHSSALEQAIQMRQDIALESDIKPPKDSKPQFALNSVFVTGATGFIGSFVVNYLSKDPAFETSKIYCLVRASDDSEALTRLTKIFASHGFDAEKVMERVIPFAGDLEKRNFGLEYELYDYLTTEVDVIFHIGATVNHILPYSKMKAANVDSVVEIIRFACTNKLKLVNYASTLGVFSGQTTVIKEDTDIETNNLQALGGYNQTKWVAEKILQEARQRGVIVNIFRPGLITWSVENGAFNPQDWLHHLVVGSILMGKAPQARAKFNFGSVDSAAKAITVLGKQAYNKNFHLTSTSLISSEQFFELVSRVRVEAKGQLSDQKTTDLLNEKIKNLAKRVLFPQWLKLVQNEINNTPADSPKRIHLTCLLYFAKGIPSDESWSVEQTNVISHAPEIAYPEIDQHSVEKFVRRLIESETVFHEK